MKAQESSRPTRNGHRSFEKGLADRGGRREEILALQEIQASFCTLSPIFPLGEGEGWLPTKTNTLINYPPKLWITYIP